MASVTTEKLTVYDFGRKLLLQNDLDPVYAVLYHARLPLSELTNWLLAYWCFYHVGTASWIAHHEDKFWERMEQAAGSKDYPRAQGRRHFRGRNAIASVHYLRHSVADKPRDAWPVLKPLLARDSMTLQEVMDHVQSWKGFGPWIAFKVADMLDRLSLVKVQFDDAAMFLFDSPREGAALLWSLEQPGTTTPEGMNRYAVHRLLKEFSRVKAPPSRDRYINVQEVETILCKWKSYYHGHYRLGEDVIHTKKALGHFSEVTLAEKLYEGGRKGELWT